MRSTVLRLLLSSLVGIFVSSGTTVAGEARLLDGKLSMQIAPGWKADKKVAPNAIAAWSRGEAWGAVVRGTRGITPQKLAGYRDAKVAEYTKGLSWLPNMKWLKKDLIQRDGRTWVDLRFIGLRDGARNNRDGLLYTRFLSTSYGGQLLEINFTSNTDDDPATKDAIDRMIESVKLAE